MIYVGKSKKRVAPQPPKICMTNKTGFNGPQPYVYGVLAKQPGTDYKIRHRDSERARLENTRVRNEEESRETMKYTRHQEMMNTSDKKYVYNTIKRLVESEMKANEHLFVEEDPKPDLCAEEEEPEKPKIIQEDLLEKEKELKKKNDEEERKLVEEKRLQLFIQNSEELRYAAVQKRKRDTAQVNFEVFKEKERAVKEQIIKNREQATLENMEIIKKQNLAKEEECRKLLEKKQKFRKELYDQVLLKETIRQQEKELKLIECNEIEKLNEKLIEEEELAKLERIKYRALRREEIKMFTEERAILFSKMNEASSQFNETYAITTQANLKDEKAAEIEAKLQLRRDIEMFIKHHKMIKEERKRQSEEITKVVVQQINEINELKKSVERQNAEARRKREEEGNKALIEQLILHKKLLEQQKEIKRKLFEKTMKEYEEYLKEEKEICENEKQCKLQYRNDLSDQVKSRKNIIEKQRKIDMENHQDCLRVFTEEEKLLKKLLSEL